MVTVLTASTRLAILTILRFGKQFQSNLLVPILYIDLSRPAVEDVVVADEEVLGAILEPARER